MLNTMPEVLTSKLGIKYYKGLIKELKENQIFVFGSNPEGRHGLGAALTAKRFFGAKYGQGYGIQGQSYAIATKDLRKKGVKTIPLSNIQKQVDIFFAFAKDHPKLIFFVTDFGSNLAGYTAKEICSLFCRSELPQNVVLSENYARTVTKLLSLKPVP